MLLNDPKLSNYVICNSWNWIRKGVRLTPWSAERDLKHVRNIYENIIHLEILFLPLYIYSQSIYWTLTVLSQLPTAKEKVFIPIPKKGNNKECSNYRAIALISHTNKVMLKILQTQLQQYMNWELPDVRAGFKKGRGTRDQLANIHWITEKAREFQENIYFSFIDYTKAFDCVDHNKLWKILQEMGIPNHLTCLQQNLYAGQEAPVRTEHGTMDWFQIGKGVCQDCILSPCLFNLYAEYTRASLIVQLVKNMPAMQETLVWFLGQKDPLE